MLATWSSKHSFHCLGVCTSMDVSVRYATVGQTDSLFMTKHVHVYSIIFLFFRYKRDTLHKQILNETKEKDKIQNDLRKLTDQLVKVNEKICDKVVARNRLDETIRETETAFTNLAMGSENLLRFMKKVTASIQPELLSEESTETNESGKKKKQSKRTEASKSEASKR